MSFYICGPKLKSLLAPCQKLWLNEFVWAIGVVLMTSSHRLKRYQLYKHGKLLVKSTWFQQPLSSSDLDMAFLHTNIQHKFTFTGQYFYFTSYDDLNTGRYISFEVNLYDRAGDHIYRDSRTFYVDNVSNCQLDVPGSDCRCQQYCSERE